MDKLCHVPISAGNYEHLFVLTPSLGKKYNPIKNILSFSIFKGRKSIFTKATEYQVICPLFGGGECIMGSHQY